MYRGIFRRLARVSGLLAALAGAAGAQLTAAVAANARYAMEELRAGFAEAEGFEAKAVYGASGTLAAQIRNGAPFDVFVSADMDFPDSLHAWGLAPDRPEPYAYGKLVMWTMRERDLSRGLALLADPSVGKIALADPRRAPYGREALDALRHAGILAEVSGKLVYGESIGQVSLYVSTGTADIALTAKAIVAAPGMRGKGKWAEVDSAAYARIAQGAVMRRYGKENHPEAAARFLAYLHSPAARTVLARYGYGLP